MKAILEPFRLDALRKVSVKIEKKANQLQLREAEGEKTPNVQQSSEHQEKKDSDSESIMIIFFRS